MIKIDEKNKCVGCGACENVCPKKCITLEEDAEGFLYPQIDANKCVDCGLCERVCPVVHSEKVQDNALENVTAYAAYSIDEPIRSESSSGGIFSLIADYVIENGGVVYGAAFDENGNVCHIAVENKTELYRLRGSKYVQSYIGDSYNQVLLQLKAGRMVLFTGTPCQVEGLKTYLRGDYDNLICVDFICHGVPSPLVFRKYVNFRESKAGSKMQRMSFRYKKYSWKTYSVRFEFENHTEYIQPFSKDLFMRTFLSDLSLRPSCYDCKFKKVNRVSDITLADFWGIGAVLPDMDDNKGISLCILHSKVGRGIFEALSEKMEYKKVNIEDAIRYNPSFIKSASLPAKRNEFMRDIADENFDVVAKKYIKSKVLLRFKRMIGKIMRKFNIIK